MSDLISRDEVLKIVDRISEAYEISHWQVKPSEFTKELKEEIQNIESPEILDGDHFVIKALADEIEKEIKKINSHGEDSKGKLSCLHRNAICEKCNTKLDIVKLAETINKNLKGCGRIVKIVNDYDSFVYECGAYTKHNNTIYLCEKCHGEVKHDKT